MKYMILTYASQRDYDAMAGKPAAQSAWSAEEFAAMGAFMAAFNQELAESGELVETRGLSAPVHTRRICHFTPHNGFSGTFDAALERVR